MTVAMAGASCMGVDGDRSDEIRLEGTRFYEATNSFIGATIQFTLQSDGDVNIVRIAGSGSSNSLDADEWHRDNPSAGLGDAWQVRATLTAGSTPSTGTMDTWLSLDTNRTWTNSQSVVGSRLSRLTFDFRVGTGPTLVTVSDVEIQARRIS